jgi:prevent-host-death family protein
MKVSVSDAKAQLTDLVRRAEAGDEVILTRRGEPKVRLVPVVADDLRERRKRALDAFAGCLKGKPGTEGATAATIADFLYDERGLPA